MTVSVCNIGQRTALLVPQKSCLLASWETPCFQIREKCCSGAQIGCMCFPPNNLQLIQSQSTSSPNSFGSFWMRCHLCSLQKEKQQGLESPPSYPFSSWPPSPEKFDHNHLRNLSTITWEMWPPSPEKSWIERLSLTSRDLNLWMAGRPKKLKNTASRWIWSKTRPTWKRMDSILWRKKIEEVAPRRQDQGVFYEWLVPPPKCSNYRTGPTQHRKITKYTGTIATALTTVWNEMKCFYKTWLLCLPKDFWIPSICQCLEIDLSRLRRNRKYFQMSVFTSHHCQSILTHFPKFPLFLQWTQ